MADKYKSYGGGGGRPPPPSTREGLSYAPKDPKDAASGNGGNETFFGVSGDKVRALEAVHQAFGDDFVKNRMNEAQTEAFRLVLRAIYGG